MPEQPTAPLPAVLGGVPAIPAHAHGRASVHAREIHLVPADLLQSPCFSSFEDHGGLRGPPEPHVHGIILAAFTTWVLGRRVAVR